MGFPYSAVIHGISLWEKKLISCAFLSDSLHKTSSIKASSFAFNNPKFAALQGWLAGREHLERNKPKDSEWTPEKVKAFNEWEPKDSLEEKSMGIDCNNCLNDSPDICGECQSTANWMPRISHFTDEIGNNVDIGAGGVNVVLKRDGTHEYFRSYGFAGKVKLTPVYVA